MPPTLSTEILVIGGGATGLGAAWDAALRGYKTLLVEKGDLTHGTSGRYHGLLHSGARYVVRDPQSAADCAKENGRLRRLMPSAIEDTGGYFVALDEDPPGYVEPFVKGCAAAGIAAAEVSPAEARRAEPLLTDRLARAFHVPDAACDSFDAAHLVSNGITAAGGEVWLRHRLARLLVEGGRVVGAELERASDGERRTVLADLVLNCAGAWAGQVAARAGCEVRVTAGKGTMVAMNYRLVNRVLNRLKPPSDGDILVPVGTVAVIGTTDIKVENPDQYAIEPWEIELLMAEGAKLLPRFREFRALRAWAGVRPLYDASKAGQPAESRLLTRAHAVLDHAARDGVEGLISVVGGKFTTFRLMAEEAVDLAGVKLGTQRACATANTPLEPAATRHHVLRGRLAASEVYPRPALVCECELVTREEVTGALTRSQSPVLNDLRRDLRLGMGPCQAGFCAGRAAALMHAGREPEPPVAESNSTLLEFLQERWKGLRPVMWGANLRQMELDLNIYRNLLGADRLPTARPPETYPTEKTA
ncbi:MAG: anaerobic glycerol-3-phosphate dehydrogenase subunit A [Anaerolineales bacterium]|nr:anaerobic glycerol-3-phosphate dehydrogenase subunit A [Anaerolineales bacterium]